MRKKECIKPTSNDSAILCEHHLEVLAKAAGVVVDDRLGVTERLHQRVYL